MRACVYLFFNSFQQLHSVRWQIPICTTEDRVMHDLNVEARHIIPVSPYERQRSSLAAVVVVAGAAAMERDERIAQCTGCIGNGDNISANPPSLRTRTKKCLVFAR